MDLGAFVFLNIFGKKTKVQLIEGLAEEKQWNGYFDPHKNLIAIDSKLDEHEFMKVLIHEIVHAVWNNGGLIQSKIPSEIEEVLAEQISIAFSDNFVLKLKNDGRKRNRNKLSKSKSKVVPVRNDIP